MDNPIVCYDFTWHIPDNTWTPELKKIHLQSVKGWCEMYCKKWAFQLECGTESNLLHFQGRISLKVKIRFSTLKKNNSKEQWGFHFSPTSKEGMKTDQYVMKEETRVDGPWSDGDIPPQILPQHQVTEWFPFQKSILEWSTRPMDSRTVNCLFCPDGNIGKSTLVGFMDHQRIAVSIPAMNDFKEMMRLLFNKTEAFYKIKREYPKLFVIDMPRAYKKDKLCGLFSAIEKLKDGYMCDDRYNFRDLWIPSPHVWVFTNDKPNSDYLSKDRWIIWVVQEKQLRVLPDLDVELKIPIKI